MHRHHHDSEHNESKRRLAATLVLTLLYMVAEAVGGYLSGSLALMADAGHMLSDGAALALSLFAAWIAHRPPTPQHSYGYYRAEILAALANGATLVGISLVIFIEAVGRFAEPHPVAGKLMMGIAAGGLVVNLIGLGLLHGGRGDSLNIHGAWLHLLTDALGSVATLVAGGLVWAYDWQWVDPAASIAICVLVLFSCWGLLKESIAILMESTPKNIDVDAIRDALIAGPGVCSVHDLHVWAISSQMVSLSVHVIVASDQSPQASLDTLRRMLHDRFGLDHTTIQIELENQGACGTAC